MKTKTELFPIAVAAGIALMLGACSQKQAGPQQRPPTPVQGAPAVKMDTPVVIDSFGNTKERLNIDIVPQVSGLLLRTFIDDGSIVTNGQPLFLIDPSDYAARAKQIQSAVEADHANLDLSKITMERNAPMLEKKLIAQQDFDTLKTKVAAAAAQLSADQAALEAAELNLNRCLITSPLDGICSKRFVDVGNLVGAGASRLTNIRSYDPLYVDFAISEAYLDQVRDAFKAGAVQIEIKPRGTSNIFTGKVTFIDNAVNGMTGTIALRGEVPNKDLKLWAQQFLDVRVIAGVVHDAVMVPEGAVQFGKMGAYLFVIKDGKADMRIVKTGVRYNDLLQIVSGVAAGEDVVVLGQLMLYPGAAVADLSKAPPPAAPGAAAAPAEKSAAAPGAKAKPEGKKSAAAGTGGKPEGK